MNQDSAQPLVSVCIPTFNRADKLARAVASLQKGTYQNLEIVISDNGSSDHTESVCRHLASTDARIVYHRHPVNKGITHNFNFAKSIATGKYFLWHGDDDYLNEHYITRCIERLEMNPALILVSGVSAYWIERSQKYRYGNIIQLRSKSGTIRAMTYLWKVWDNSILCGAYRRESVKELSLPNILAGDWAWLAGVAVKGEAEVLPDIYVYRSHGDTASGTMSRQVKTLGLPLWQIRLSPIVISHNCAVYVSHLIARTRAFQVAIYYPTVLSLMLAKLATEKVLRMVGPPPATHTGRETKISSP